MKMRLFVLFILAFGSKETEIVAENNTSCGEFDEIKVEEPIIVKIEEDKYDKRKKNKSSEFIGVNFHKTKWRAYRHTKNENKMFFNGNYDSEEAAAHASDTLARQLMQNGDQNLKLNFPDDETEVHKKNKSSEFIGVSFNKIKSKWRVQRHSKLKENKKFYNGYYDSEKAAAHASDTLARRLMQNGEQHHKLNFPEDDTEVHKNKKSSKYIGVSFNKTTSKWRAQRYNKSENKTIHNGYHNTEEAAANASDTLAKKLMENDEQSHKLNFPDKEDERKKKRKRSKELKIAQNN